MSYVASVLFSKRLLVLGSYPFSIKYRVLSKFKLKFTTWILYCVFLMYLNESSPSIIFYKVIPRLTLEVVSTIRQTNVNKYLIILFILGMLSLVIECTLSFSYS